MVVSLRRGLRTESGSSARAASTLNSRSIPPVPEDHVVLHTWRWRPLKTYGLSLKFFLKGTSETEYNTAQGGRSYRGITKGQCTLEMFEGLAKAHTAGLVSLHRALKMHVSRKFLRQCWCCRDHNLRTNIKGIHERSLDNTTKVTTRNLSLNSVPLFHDGVYSICTL